MKYEHRSLHELPTLVKQIMFLQEGYLVGSGCEWFLDRSPDAKLPKDFDVMIEPDHYMNACQLIGTREFKLNSFGGLKILGEIEIDMWPMTLSTYIGKLKGNIAIRLNPFKAIRW